MKVFVFQYFPILGVNHKNISFTIVVSLIFRVCSKPLPEIAPVPNVSQKLVVGAILSFHVLKKAPFGYNFRAAGRQKQSPPNYGWRPGADTAFHETAVNTVPLGLTGF